MLRRAASRCFPPAGSRSAPAAPLSRMESAASHAVRAAPILVPLVLLCCWSLAKAGAAAAALGLALTALGAMLLSERCLLRAAAAARPQGGGSEEGPPEEGPAPPAAAHRSAEDIPTVPWAPVRGPRLRHDARVRRRSAEVVQLSRQMRGLAAAEPPPLPPGSRGGPSDPAEQLLRVRSGIQAVQSALYGEPARGEFSAQRMGFEEAALEVERLACTVGVGGRAANAAGPAALLRKLGKIKAVLGISHLQPA